MDTLTFLSNYLGELAWLVSIMAVLAAGVMVSWLEALVSRRLQKKYQQSTRLWDDVLIDAFHKPFLLFMWLVILTWVWRIIVVQVVGSPFFSRWPTIYQMLGIILILLIVMRFLSGLQKAAVRQVIEHPGKWDRTSISAVFTCVRACVITIAIIIAMQTLGIPISALLAFGGVSGIAVGFAAQDTLANFLGGMMIYVDRPFGVGDWISSPEKDIEGTVEEIGWRLTKIRAFDKRPLYVPNGLFSKIVVKNPSRMTNRRIKATVGVRYDDASKVSTIVKDITAMLKQHDDIDTKQTCFVAMVEFGDSALNILVYTFTKTTNWVEYQNIQQDVFLKIIDIITQHGAECAFPTTTMDFPNPLTVVNQPNQEMAT